MENRISISIPPAELQQVRDAFATINTIMGQYFAELSKGKAKHLARMSDGTLPFVQKATEFAESNPQFNPPFLDVVEMRKDLEAYIQLKPFFVAAEQLQDDFTNTSTLAGAEAYDQARIFYNSVKYAAKMGIAGAQALYDELRKRYESQGDRKGPEM
ncbi:hypothetical protein [Algoriphagus yeomjeoni]|uniref:Uncharacterized protein n=1 Tax=Algoriphagus yeomjeoni TaxID=291403 RepID=A0A327PAY0_9BACT|nr:hypothetical protein [Algoriphagus yeomjeoni]RAI86966.1 hypothetical protein LV83_03070 [Algoriphagus yeomjeoni]